MFVISGAFVQNVTNKGAVTTRGQNDMVLDNWGDVQTWTALQPITSHGPSGIGLVNFSDIGTLTVNAPIRTYGKGARGFNLYDGSVKEVVLSRSRLTVTARSACSCPNRCPSSLS